MKVSQWYFIPPPYDMSKPISLSAPPHGAVNITSNSPYDTIQVIGRSRTSTVPQTVSIDMGIKDILISNFGQDIAFYNKGTMTDVGTREPSTTKGMSIPSTGDYMPEDTSLIPGEPISMQEIRGINRYNLSKKSQKRKRGMRGVEYHPMQRIRR